jgi:hypothetical protein
MALEHNCVDERTSVGNNKNKDNNDGYNSVDEKRGRNCADNNDGNNLTVTKMGNNNSSNSAGSTNQREELSPGKLKLWYDRLSVVQQRQVEMNVNAVLYSGCMAEAPQLFDTMEHQQKADNDDNDNVVGDWNLDDDLVVGGDVARNNDQEIAANIRGEEHRAEQEEESTVTENNGANMVVGEGVADNKNQKIAAELEAESTETANTTSSQATHNTELVTGTNRSEYLMRKLTIEEEDTVERKLSPGALLPSSINQKDLLTLAGRKGGGKLNTNIINMYTQVVLK